MYQPHFSPWFIILFMLCVLGMVIARLISLKVGDKQETVAKILCVGFLLFFLLITGSKTYDAYRLRAELREIQTGKILHFRLSNGKASREIDSALDIQTLMSQMQLLKDIWAHHSHPVDPFTIDFKYDGESYEYEISRDSERPDEYWINAVGRDDDIGRVHSDDLGEILQCLLAEKS